MQCYGIKSKPVIVENLRPDLVERMNRALGGMARTDNFEDIDDPMREVDSLLSSCPWALRSTASVVIGKTPGQLI